jgi:hypothetical protein
MKQTQNGEVVEGGVSENNGAAVAPAENAAATVTQDAEENRFYTIYLGILALLGIGLCVLSYVYEWGFWGWFGGIFLLVAGGGGMLSMAKTGGVGKVECPACGGAFSVLHISMHRTVSCPHCHTYVEGAETMQVVPADRVAADPVFEAPLPKGFEWPKGCPVCNGPVTHTKKVEGMSVGGGLAMVAAPVGVARVSAVQAPCCDEHEDGVVLYRRASGTLIGFRSHAYWKRFCELNEIDWSAVKGEPTADSRSTG